MTRLSKKLDTFRGYVTMGIIGMGVTLCFIEPNYMSNCISCGKNHHECSSGSEADCLKLVKLEKEFDELLIKYAESNGFVKYRVDEDSGQLWVRDEDSPAFSVFTIDTLKKFYRKGILIRTKDAPRN